ncbi:MBL fold metallo-hydrolase [Amycolatopsis sp. NPDC005232]|uniref:MBL fold metallo-hydrolase n=1 Tax=Amycolatopsis sp. NPDC005232 TaxID=3157027 RepID=UPI0033AC29A2
MTITGTVTRFTRGETTFHTYTAPELGGRVNTHIVETRTELTLIDAQLLLPMAREVVEVVKGLGKPLGRIFITHGHQDHYSGLQVLDEEFPGTTIWAVESVRNYMTQWSQQVLDARRAVVGDVIAERAVHPDRTLALGETMFPGFRINVEEVTETEAHSSALITFPEERVLSANDNFSGPGYNLFFGSVRNGNAENWIALLEKIKARTDIDIVLSGHGPNTDPRSGAEVCIEWLRTAIRARGESADAAAYAAAMKARYPDNLDPIWIDFGAEMLYGVDGALNPAHGLLDP